jgi:hypothetical protein
VLELRQELGTQALPGWFEQRVEQREIGACGEWAALRELAAGQIARARLSITGRRRPKVFISVCAFGKAFFLTPAYSNNFSYWVSCSMV